MLVCGPGRSGTSLVMSSLVGLGLRNPGDMIAPNAINPAGFWEDGGAVGINQGLLRCWGLEGAGGFAAPMPRGWTEAPEARAALPALSAHLRRLRPARAPWGFKDPRISLLLPLWREAAAGLGSPVEVVVALRHPSAVALSFQAAAGAPPELGELMWLNRVAHLIRDCEDATLVHFEDMVADARSALGALAAVLRLAPDRAAGVARALLARPRLRPELAHHPEPPAPASALAADLHGLLRPLSGRTAFGPEIRALVGRYFALHDANPGWGATVRFMQARLDAARPAPARPQA